MAICLEYASLQRLRGVSQLAKVCSCTLFLMLGPLLGGIYWCLKYGSSSTALPRVGAGPAGRPAEARCHSAGHVVPPSVPIEI